MTRWRGVALVLAFAAPLGGGCATVHRQPHTGEVAEVRGASIGLTPEYLDVRHKTGQVFRVRLDTETSFTARNEPAARDCVVPGTRLATLTTFENGAWKANRITIFSGRCVRK